MENRLFEQSAISRIFNSPDVIEITLSVKCGDGITKTCFVKDEENIRRIVIDLINSFSQT